MLNGCYTFKELKEKFNWETSEGTIENQIRYARNRGVEIEKAFKQGKTYFYLKENNIEEEEWKIYPNDDYFEVSKNGKVRTAKGKKIVGALSTNGYMIVSNQTIKPTQYYRINRMVLETFNPIDNSEMYVADHINGIKTDNTLKNLRWVTQRHNCEQRDENYAKLNENYQKLIEKYGYFGLNQLFEAILNEN